MRQHLSLHRRAATAARWPLGVLAAAWDYLWRTTPMTRRLETGSPRADSPPPLPPDTDRSDHQGIEEGYGPLMHRRYVARVKDAELDGKQLINAFAGDPNRVTPRALASFEKLRGEAGVLRVGDEFTVRMPGPWDGPVRVVEIADDGFGLATLDGHLEAGRIQFTAAELGPGRLEVRIEAWARGGDRVSNLLFDRLPVNKEIQLHMWISVLERFIRLSGGTRDGRVEITTRRVDPAQLSDRLAQTPRAQRALAGLNDRPLNFDPRELDDPRPGSGWNVDDYRQRLPPEAPGEPIENGSFELARRLMCDYAFADPKIVRAVYDPADELADRNMLLQARFGPLRIFLGCRVSAIVDDTREVDGRPVRIWGWSYGTLQGHVERGQMDYAVWKWLDDGTLEFRIHVVSRRAKVRNPIVRLGFRLVGRREQRRFARRACERMSELVQQGLASGRAPSAGGAHEAGAAQLAP